MSQASKREMITIRPFEERDWAATWRIIEPVFRAGETYAFSPDIKEEEAHKVWVEIPTATYVAVNDSNEVLGTYYIKPNQPALGAHVCNCGYIVSENARGKGIASEMCEHSQREAIDHGYQSMQYNLVVATNENAVRLWKKHGFEVIGNLPEAFRHSQLGLVDAFVMYKQLKTQRIKDLSVALIGGMVSLGYVGYSTYQSLGVAVYLNSWIYLCWVVLLHPVWHRLVIKEEIMMFQNFVMKRNGQELTNPIVNLLSTLSLTYKLDQNGILNDIEGYETLSEQINSSFPPDVARQLSHMLNSETLKQKENDSSISGKIIRLIDPATMSIYQENLERIMEMEIEFPRVGLVPTRMVEKRICKFVYKTQALRDFRDISKS